MEVEAEMRLLVGSQLRAPVSNAHHQHQQGDHHDGLPPSPPSKVPALIVPLALVAMSQSWLACWMPLIAPRFWMKSGETRLEELVWVEG